MNRFNAAGLRLLKQDMIRKEWPEHGQAQIDVPEGTTTGDVFAAGHYVCMLDEPRREDGTAVCFLKLDPVKAASIREAQKNCPPGSAAEC